MRGVRIALGLACWTAIAVASWAALDGRFATHANAAGSTRHLWDYLTGERRVIELRAPAPLMVGIGDPLFIQAADGGLEQVGEVRALYYQEQVAPLRRAKVRQVQMVLFPSAPPVARDARVRYVAARESLSWVMETLLTPRRKQIIAAELTRAFEEHREEIIAALQPVIEDSLRDGVAIVREDLPKVLKSHEQELDALTDKYQREIVERDLMPLVQEEIWPIVQRRAEPTINDVGREIWDEVSLWSFGWRLAYDQFMPRQRLTEQEWQRFVEDDAMPILERHSDEFVAIVRDSVTEASQNERVREAVRESMKKIGDDPEFQELMWKIAKEAVVDNPRVHKALAKHWTGPKAQQAFRIASVRLEPTVRRIADLLLGSREAGITPEFALVLRNQVLLKDRRWFLLETPGSARTKPVGQPVQWQVISSSDAPSSRRWSHSRAPHVRGG